MILNLLDNEILNYFLFFGLKIESYFLVTTRTTLDEHIEPVAEDLTLPRGVIRPHLVSPFTRNVKTKKEVDEAGDMAEAVSCLLDFSKRTGLTTPPPPPPMRPPMVRNLVHQHLGARLPDQ